MYLFLFSDPATTEIYTLSLHDALPILSNDSEQIVTAWMRPMNPTSRIVAAIITSMMLIPRWGSLRRRSEEHTSELQSRVDLVCRLLLEKKKKDKIIQKNKRANVISRRS